MGKDNNYIGRRDPGGFLLGLFFCLFFRTYSWLCSVPMWLTLILHFVIGLSWWWFFATLAAWLLAGVIRYCVLVFARWGTRTAPQNKDVENKNPYSVKDWQDLSK